MKARRLAFFLPLTMVLIISADLTPPAVAALPEDDPTPTPDPLLTAEASALMEEAGNLFGQGDLSGALARYQQALAIRRQTGDRAGQSVALFNIGVVHYRLYEYEEALDYYGQSLAIKRELGDRAGEASTLNAMAAVHKAVYEYEEALVYYGQVLAIRQAMKDVEGEASALNSMAIIHDDLSQYDQALELYEQALAVCRQIGFQVCEAGTTLNIGLVFSALSQYELALDHYDQALAIFVEIGDAEGEALALNNMAVVYEILSEHEQALECCQRALAIYRDVGDPVGEARALGNLGYFYTDLADYRRALGYFQQALAIFRAADDGSGEAITLYNLAAVHFYLSEYEQALDRFQQALSMYRDIGYRAGEAKALSGIGAVHDELSQYDQALDYHQQALSILREIGDRRGEAFALHSMGIVYRYLSDYEQALDCYEQSLSISREIGDRASEADTLNNIGLVYEALSENDQALDYHLQSIAVREEIRGGVRVESFRIALAGQEVDVYQAAVRLLAAMGRGVEAFEVAERSRARAFLDGMGNQRLDLGQAADAGLVEEERELRGELAALESDLVSEKSLPAEEQNEQVVESIEAQVAEKQGEYEDLLAQLELANPELASLVTIETATVTETQALLDEETTLIAYYLAGQEGLAFVLSEEEFELVELGATAEEIGQAVASFRSLGLANLDNAYPRSLSDLYAWLIEPLLPYLDTPQVGIVPHQTLHYVPFAALHDGEEYLGEQYVLFHLPSASALPYIEEKAGREGAGAVVLGDPETGNPDLGALEYAGREAEQVAGLLGVEALLGEEAGEAALGEAVGGAGVVHVAAHGSFNAAAPLFSRLWLAPGEGEDGRLNVYEVYGLDLERASVVVLSACQTQVGELSAGDEVVGLNRAFLYGAPTVVASLWPVDDEATGVLMVSFYSHLLEGKGKAEALQAAQEEVRRDEEHPQWAHPYYWAGFVLSGDGGVVEGLAGESAGEGQGICPSAAILPLGLAIVALGRVRRRRGAEPGGAW